MIDVGHGPPLVLIPGIQGRWEWMQPTVTALAARFRVITRSLPGEPGQPGSENGFDQFVEYTDRLFDEAGLSAAVVCGISFGGLVALRYAALRPGRVRALILVSTPGPRWQPAGRQGRYLRRPLLSAPLFLAGAARRGWIELRTTLPDAPRRLAFSAMWCRVVLTAPAAPWRMAARARLAARETFEQDCAKINAPTLVVAGEEELDKVVKLSDTMQYVQLIRGAEFCLFERTGHLGPVSAPDRFAAIVSAFAARLPE